MTIRQEIEKLLSESAMTGNDLAEATGVNKVSVMRALKGLHNKKIVRIIAWHRDGTCGRFGGVYTVGAGDDAPRPQAVSSTLRVRAFRAKQRSQVK